ncbi:MAG TPA: acetylglutamate kinase [Terriglobales bacterium]|nr:acetylglutamate kinase [Terriglobales bacterium]
MLKVGGAALDDAKLRRECAQAIAAVAREHEVAVVHGGGAALTRTLARLGKKSEFVGGLRVTDAETRDAAVMVLAGGVNKQLVAELAMLGCAAIGLCGGDAAMFRAKKRGPNGHGAPHADLGFVGDVCNADARWIRALWSERCIPVIASLALGHDGEYYNVNADQMAAACAVAVGADALVFLTDVPGVKDAFGIVMKSLSVSQIPALVESQVIAGGMLPKLEACSTALEQGVARVLITPAAEAGALREIASLRFAAGTEVHA